ncbi:hypothetical protein T484DRAFT_1769033 [Baffinella frigidus]|nr:hypothetical protein T484DRAFT_1769033 [Cryptophyta sp. CCMP2293]
MARPGTVDYGKWEKMAAEMSDDEEAEEAADEERRRSAQLAREQRMVMDERRQMEEEARRVEQEDEDSWEDEDEEYDEDDEDDDASLAPRAPPVDPTARLIALQAAWGEGERGPQDQGVGVGEQRETPGETAGPPGGVVAGSGKRCLHCMHTNAKYRCGKCKRAWFCGRMCQEVFSSRRVADSRRRV